MALMPGGAPTIQIPRWIQLVGLPMLALLAFFLAAKVFHALFLFLVAGLVALLLDPLVRVLEKLNIPRGFVHVPEFNAPDPEGGVFDAEKLRRAVRIVVEMSAPKS